MKLNNNQKDFISNNFNENLGDIIKQIISRMETKQQQELIDELDVFYTYNDDVWKVIQCYCNPFQNNISAIECKMNLYNDILRVLSIK